MRASYPDTHGLGQRPLRRVDASTAFRLDAGTLQAQRAGALGVFGDGARVVTGADDPVGLVDEDNGGLDLAHR